MAVQRPRLFEAGSNGSIENIRRRFSGMLHTLRMHLTGYSGLRALPPTGEAGR